MDSQSFDRFTRALAAGTSRRRLLKWMVGGAGAAAAGFATRASAAADGRTCAQFCLNLLPGPARGQCVADCQQGGGLYAACGGDPTRLCVASSGSATCCGINQTCTEGTCACEPNYQYCAPTQTCLLDYCQWNYRLVFDPDNCAVRRCKCDAQYVTLPGGGCAVPCESDTDCAGLPFSEYCATSASGMRICTNRSYLPYCTPCQTDADCYLGCSAINAFCEDGVCRGAT